MTLIMNLRVSCPRKEGTVRHCQSEEASILWSHHQETRELPGERNNARNNAIYTVFGKKLPLYFSQLCQILTIFKILSPTDLAVNFLQNHNKISHHTSNASLHYFVEY